MHRAVHITHRIQRAMGRPLTPYNGHTTFRSRVVWNGHVRHLRAVWFPWPQWWRDEAGCIHRHESVDWHEPSAIGPGWQDPGGGLQFMPSTWTNRVADGLRFAPLPEQATRHEQLLAAWALWRYDGDWHEWTTAPLCGLS